MRQEYIQEMTDPVRRVGYIEADAQDNWAPKSTRGFQHSETVAEAWSSLRETIRHTARDTSDVAADLAISEYVNRSLTMTQTSDNKYIQINEREVGFGHEWTADQVADMVAQDIIPDVQLTTLLRSARATSATLTSLAEATKSHDDRERDVEAINADNDDYYDGSGWDHESDPDVQKADGKPAQSFLPPSLRAVHSSFPDHPSAAIHSAPAQATSAQSLNSVYWGDNHRQPPPLNHVSERH